MLDKTEAYHLFAILIIGVPRLSWTKLAFVREPRETAISAGRITSKTRRVYKFIDAHRDEFSIQLMCRLLGVARAGCYAWREHPISDRAQEGERLFRLIRASFPASHGIYGATRVFLDPRELGETCSKHRVARLMQENGLSALHGYRIRHIPTSTPHFLIPNLLQRQFAVSRPNEAWVTDITYIRTWEGWPYLAVVLDLFSRRVVGWAVRPTIHWELVLDSVTLFGRGLRPRLWLTSSRTGKVPTLDWAIGVSSDQPAS